jgi:adenosylhomocysteine nucleosidase
MLLVTTFALLALVAQGSPDTPRPIVVQGAMQIEVDALAHRLEHPVEEQVAGWTFWRGTIDGYPVIVSKTLKGMTNAAAATLLAVERFRPLAILNQGTAGGHDASLHNYDIVIGRSAVNLGAFRSRYRAAGTGSNPLDWMPLDLTRPDGSAANDPSARRLSRFDADASLVAVALAARPSYTRGKIVEGTIGSSDMWNDELDLIAHYNRDFGTTIEEMETASAAQIASEMRVPFLGIRVISDNITNGDAWDPKTSEACEDYVIQVVKAYIKTLTR